MSVALEHRELFCVECDYILGHLTFLSADHLAVDDDGRLEGIRLPVVSAHIVNIGPAKICEHIGALHDVHLLDIDGGKTNLIVDGTADVAACPGAVEALANNLCISVVCHNISKAHLVAVNYESRGEVCAAGDSPILSGKGEVVAERSEVVVCQTLVVVKSEVGSLAEIAECVEDIGLRDNVLESKLAVAVKAEAKAV